jgi:hypothetical protein
LTHPELLTGTHIVTGRKLAAIALHIESKPLVGSTRTFELVKRRCTTSNVEAVDGARMARSDKELGLSRMEFDLLDSQECLW